jgi:drug/metabolite transporter (DMT)-like permease
MTAASIGFFTYVVKYFELVYVGLAGNFVPLLTIVLSRCFLGEQISKVDKIVILISVIGVGTITYGKIMKSELEEKDKKVDKSIPIFALIGLLSLPLLSSAGAILMRKMKGLHWLTLTLYLNICLITICSSFMLV